ncbi:hypothetical protein XBFFL1_310025 [Xenorhabdus bovienii str. feltiae Florida]|nr:hypothetical protein XBFFL1_310025 [Xenorhabdus bovienii str. feltiae Florida]
MLIKLILLLLVNMIMLEFDIAFIVNPQEHISVFFGT